MGKRNAAPINIGLVFDWHAANSRQTVIQLDRPLDVAPDRGTTLDGAALAGLVHELSACLAAAGLRRGDRLAIVKDNHFDIVLTAAAAARIGALPVMIAPIASIEAIRIMVGRIDPAVLVAGASVLARAAAAGTTLAVHRGPLIAVGTDPALAAADALSLDDLRGGPNPPVRIGGDHDPMIVTHTSGTTGVPKLVVHSAYTALGARPYQLESTRIPLLTSGRDDVVASCISFAHMRALSWTRSQLSIAPRAMVVISDPDPDSAARTLARHLPTSLEALPNVFQRWEELADRRPELFAQVKRFISTFDAIHPRTVRKFLDISQARFPVWAWGLGQSEIAGISANIFTRRTVRPGPRANHDATNIGWPTLVRVRLVDPVTGRRAARGGPGLIMVKTPTRCLTYLGEADRHRAKVDGKWWNTGDLGMRAGFGRIKLVDREVDLLPGVSCIEIESTLLDRLPRASEVVVLATPDGPPVPVVCTPDGLLDQQDWDRAVAGLIELAEPRVLRWADVPRTATWKVRRSGLREQLLGEAMGLGSGQWT
ncbi:class I adenylate-forming enzyme family protein [Nocardia sp. NPDC051321]|uniref:class I adenylate-forming enzyme family protein n=1 Tax=Nocardia sp. NPDC051321 TaxID=3364323 RepID=UPI0037A4BD1D